MLNKHLKTFLISANATEEFFVRRSPLYEVLSNYNLTLPFRFIYFRKVVGQLGMWGTLINGIQAASLEHVDMTNASWNGATSEPLFRPQLIIRRFANVLPIQLVC